MAAADIRNPTATAHGIANFAPLPEAERSGIGLCLSGGGYRAALFHLGVLRRFNELGILPQVTTISSVSGGSIISAFLATKIAWPLSAPVADWERSISAPFRNFTSTNIRTGALLKSLLPWVRAVSALASTYESSLTQLKLGDIPPKPTFILCATDLGFGVNWTFERSRMGDYQGGYVAPTPPTWPLGLAVAASSCFPPVFNPLPIRLKPSQFTPGKFPLGSKRDRILSTMRLSDGGVYDNLGLEPVWRSHKVVLSSDGGALFDPAAERNIFRWVKGYVAIPENQALALRKRWLISNFLNGTLTGTYCGIGSLATNYGNPAATGYGNNIVENCIAKIRTDLDRFSDAESRILENHGYCLADAAARRHIPNLISSGALPFALPHPSWMNEDAARKALENSWRRTLVGRGWL